MIRNIHKRQKGLRDVYYYVRKIERERERERHKELASI